MNDLYVCAGPAQGICAASRVGGKHEFISFPETERRRRQVGKGEL